MHTVCRKCYSETPDGDQLCASCLEALMVDLRAVPDVVEDLLITRSKQDNMGEHARVSGSRERPLGFRPGAMSAEDVLRETLLAWACVVHALAYGDQQADVSGNSVELAAFMRRHPTAIRRCDGAAVMSNEIAHAVSNARNAGDRPAEKRFAGRCVCTELLFTYERAKFVKCPTCGERHEVALLQAGVLVAIRQYVGTAADIASGIGQSLSGGKLSRKLINKWHSRGRITPRDFTPSGDPMFMVGDVLDLMGR